MSPAKLRLWLQIHGEPISIRSIEAIKQKETGNFSERQIRKSMKALEAAGLVSYETGPQNEKLWSAVKVEAEPAASE